MKVVICIKPIKSELIYPNESRTGDFAINPYDLYALEKVIELKKFIDCQIICLCMGPMNSKGLLHKAIAAGADEAILLYDEVFQGSDAIATSYILAKAIKKIGNVELIACGKRSVDGETGQAVYGIGERLNYYCLTDIAEILDTDNSTMKVKQVKESEMIIGLLKIPAVISFCDYAVTQPIISLLALKKARKKEILLWNATDLEIDENKCGLEGSKTKVMHVQKKVKEPKLYIEGTSKEKADLIYNIMTGKTTI